MNNGQMSFRVHVWPEEWVFGSVLDQKRKTKHIKGKNDQENKIPLRQPGSVGLKEKTEVNTSNTQVNLVGLLFCGVAEIKFKSLNLSAEGFLCCEPTTNNS